MGKFDSSKTRVVPVFNALYTRDPSGLSWLDSVIELGDRAGAIREVPSGRGLAPDHGMRWGNAEQALPAPHELLRYLVQTVTVEAVEKSRSTGQALQKRLELARRNPATLREALAAIDSGQRGRLWFILEGSSYPDALLETEDYVVCVEGKRTERACTDRTTWMPIRVQLLRHMDAALEHFPGKQVFGLLIVEGSGSQPTAPSEHWRAQSRAQYDPERVAASLPHRSVSERLQLANGVLGVATWQAVCERHGLPWPPFRDEGGRFVPLT